MDNLETSLVELGQHIQDMNSKYTILKELNDKIQRSSAFSSKEKESTTHRLEAFGADRDAQAKEFKRKWSIYETKIKQLVQIIDERKKIIDDAAQDMDIEDMLHIFSARQEALKNDLQKYLNELDI